jgi:hypothetical protein
MLHPYHESLLSQLYPGSQPSSTAFEPAVQLFEERLALPETRRHKVVWRVDGGFGSDHNIEWLVQRGYQVLAKGVSNRRAGKLLLKVQRWRTLRSDKWVGAVATPQPFSRPVYTFVLRRLLKGEERSAYLYTTLPWSGVQIASLYDQRGGAETEFRSDKSGGAHLDQHHKHKRDAQEAWIHLTDIAHNYLAWFQHHILTDSPLADFGHLRICRDLMHIPGTIEMHEGRLLSVKLSRAVPHAAPLLDCLQRFWQ